MLSTSVYIDYLADPGTRDQVASAPELASRWPQLYRRLQPEHQQYEGLPIIGGVWHIAEDDSGVEAAIAAARDLVIAEALPWFHRFRDPEESAPNPPRGAR